MKLILRSEIDALDFQYLQHPPDIVLPAEFMREQVELI